MASTDASDEVALRELLRGEHAKIGQLSELALLNDGELSCVWPQIGVDLHLSAVSFLRKYTDAGNYPTVVSKVVDPVIERVVREGVWRNANVDITTDRDKAAYVTRTLRRGFADKLYDDEVRVVTDAGYKDAENIVRLRWQNLDPKNAAEMRDHLLDRDFSDAALPPEDSARGGIGALTIKDNEYGAGYEVGYADLTWAPDGSGVIDLVIVDVGADKTVTFEIDESRTATLYYGYNLPPDGLSTFLANHGIDTYVQHQENSFRVLRRKDETGTFDVMGSKIVYADQTFFRYERALGEESATEIHTRAAAALVVPIDADIGEGITLARTNTRLPEGDYYTEEQTRTVREMDTGWLTVPAVGQDKYYRTVKHSTLATLAGMLAGLSANYQVTLSASWNNDKSLNFTITRVLEGTSATQWKAGIAVDIAYENAVWKYYKVTELLTSNDLTARDFVQTPAAIGGGYTPVGWHGPYRTGIKALGFGKWMATVVYGKM